MSYLTDEERKKPWTWQEDYFTFVTSVDLSAGIDVYPTSDSFKLTPSDPRYSEALSRDVATFVAHFMLFTHPNLNGFSGIDCITWRFHGNEKPV